MDSLYGMSPYIMSHLQVSPLACSDGEVRFRPQTRTLTIMRPSNTSPLGHYRDQWRTVFVVACSVVTALCLTVSTGLLIAYNMRPGTVVSASAAEPVVSNSSPTDAEPTSMFTDPAVAEFTAQPATVRAAVIDDQPWSPGARLWIPLPDNMQTRCSVAFSFADTTGQGYAVTAAHCGGVGQVVEGDDGRKAGEIVYTDPVLDWALVKITDPGVPVLTVAAAESGINPVFPPMALLAETLTIPREVSLFGSTSVHETGVLSPWQHRTDTGSALMDTTACARGGDSGGAALVPARDQAGTPAAYWVAVGVISTGVLDCGEANPYPEPGRKVKVRDHTGSQVVPVSGIVDTLRSQVPSAEFPEVQVTV